MTDNSEPDTGKSLIEAVDAAAPKGWRRLMASVASQLLIGTEWGANYYARASEIKDRVEGRSKVNAIIAEAVGQQAITDPDVMNRAKARFLGDLHQKQANLEDVITRAAERLEQRDAPGEDEAVANPLGEDWASAFAREAELASSDELRERLAKILAGEISRPGSVRRATIRKISELERDELEAFELTLRYRVGDKILLPTSWAERDRLPVLLHAEQAGLLGNAAGGLAITFRLDDSGVGILAGDKYGLVARGEAGLHMGIAAAPLTRAGIEIADLLDVTNEREALKLLYPDIPTGSMTFIGIGSVSFPAPGSVAVQNAEQLWPLVRSVGIVSGRPFGTM